MVSKKSILGITALSLIALSTATSGYAKPSCPTVSEVKDGVTGLNAVMRQSERHYFVLSAQPAVHSSDLDWIVATQTSSKGFDAAFASGETAVKSVISAITSTPIEQSGFYICTYMSTEGMVITAAQKPQQAGLTPLIINPDLFKLQK